MPVILTSTGITFNDGSTTTTSLIPTGTLMLFQQTAAPTGWTKQTTHDNKALRCVSGTAGYGGTAAFTTCFVNQTPLISVYGSVSGTTLDTSAMPSHTHIIQGGYPDDLNFTGNYNGTMNSDGGQGGAFTTLGTGGNISHAHGLSVSGSSAPITLNVQYVDMIIASKN
jgi:hypothetical protein